MSNIKILFRNIVVWLLASSFWAFMGFQTTDITWFSILMFIFSGFCGFLILLQIAILIRWNKDINKLKNFPDAMK